MSVKATFICGIVLLLVLYTVALILKTFANDTGASTSVLLLANITAAGLAGYLGITRIGRNGDGK